MIGVLIFIAGQITATISPEEFRSSEKIGAVCKMASSIAIETSDAGDWLRAIRRAGSEGGLSEGDQALLIKMCGVYSVAERDAAQTQLLAAKRKLEDMAR